MSLTTQFDDIEAVLDDLYADSTNRDLLISARETLVSSSNGETDDGSISVGLWHTLDEHVGAFERMQSNHAAWLKMRAGR
jgi:hypothetical protein